MASDLARESASRFHNSGGICPASKFNWANSSAPTGARPFAAANTKGAAILDRAGDIANAMSGKRAAVPNVMGADGPDLFAMIAAINEADEMLSATLSEGFTARLNLAPPDGAPAEPFAQLAAMQQNFAKGAQAWRENIARLAAATDTGAPELPFTACRCRPHPRPPTVTTRPPVVRVRR